MRLAIHAFLNYLASGAGSLVFVAALYFLLWNGKKKRYGRVAVGPLETTDRELWRDIKICLLSLLIVQPCYGVVYIFIMYKLRLSKVYFNINDRGWIYFFFSVAAFFLLTDALKYWSHRALHTPALFRWFHSVHHAASHTNPFTTYLAHPAEFVLQMAIPSFVMAIIPMHTSAIAFVLLFLNFQRTIQHVGFEWILWSKAAPAFFRIFVWGAHHELHHSLVQAHFAGIFTFWDRMMGTESPLYKKSLIRLQAR